MITFMREVPDYEVRLEKLSRYWVPVATNIATAEVIVTALDRGDLDWREIINPRSAYNMKLRAKNSVN